MVFSTKDIIVAKNHVQKTNFFVVRVFVVELYSIFNERWYILITLQIGAGNMRYDDYSIFRIVRFVILFTKASNYFVVDEDNSTIVKFT